MGRCTYIHTMHISPWNLARHPVLSWREQIKEPTRLINTLCKLIDHGSLPVLIDIVIVLCGVVNTRLKLFLLVKGHHYKVYGT